jgi:hypothetical protein
VGPFSEIEHYGKREWIAVFKRVYKNDGHLSTMQLQHRHPQIYEQEIWIFGDWDKALRGAGFDPKIMRMRAVWDREKVIVQIRRMRKQSLPIYAHYAMKNHQSLFRAALRQFGSWNQALIAAGVEKKQVFGMVRNQPSRILPALRDTLDSPAIYPKR